MFGFLKSFLGFDKKHYEKEKNILKAGSVESRKEMASGEKTNPEVLYYLAKDEDPEVRMAVTNNKATPVHASALLANDEDKDVRLALAKRLVELLPELSTDEHSKLYAYAVQALGVLAEDEVITIRKALSSSLKDYAKAPPKIVGQLARDVEREVAEPVLRFCLALSDDDLLDILKGHPESWVISTIAERPVISDPVATAVIETKDIPANKVLIKNEKAKLSKSVLLKIVESSRDCVELQEELVTRKDLSYDLAQRIAGFVSDSILKIMEKRNDFDPEFQKEIVGLVKRRMEFQNEGTPFESADNKVERYRASGKLDAGVVEDAIAWGDKDFVLLAIARLARVHPIVAEKMLKSGSAKSIIALSWQAKLPMRTAIILQRSYGDLQPNEVIYAKNGTDYPLTAAEIKWQLEFYGIELGIKEEASDVEKESDI